MNRFSIRDIENLTGIKAHTIRIWEQRYGILAPKRTDTNIRYYDAEDLKLALRVSLLNNYGYRISRIHKMRPEEMNEIILDIADQNFQLKVLANKLIEATLNWDMDLFEEMVDEYTEKYGIEIAVEELIFHFLEKIGLMWMANKVFPAQEHLVSHIIYRKVSLAIERLPKVKQQVTKVLLFLPEGEVHDMGLLYVYYLMKKHGKNPLYLGPNTPLKEVSLVHSVKAPEYLYVHLTSVADDFDDHRYLEKLGTTFPQTKILVSGSMLHSRKYIKRPNIQLCYSLAEVKDLVPGL
jgi:DNA-binding transcriptional MerR regulator